MNYLSLQIDNQWVNLKEGTEIALEGNNPIFSDAGSKTYLFQLHVDSNRHLFGNSDDIFGDSYYKVIDGKPATLYVAGIPIMVGKVSLEDEVYVDDDGCIAVNLISGNLEFAQMIEGMNCRDVEQAEEVVVGHRYTDVHVQWQLGPETEIDKDSDVPALRFVDYELPPEFVVFRNPNFSGDNVWDEYPSKKYCTIRVCYKDVAFGSSKDEGEEKKFLYRSAFWINTGNKSENKDMPLQLSTQNPILPVLESCRMSSGICFYINYFLDCLSKTLGIRIIKDDLCGIEDFNRLAFVNLRCDIISKGVKEKTSWSETKRDIGAIRIYDEYGYTDGGYSYRTEAVATSGNFPDEDVEKVFDALYSGFGVIPIQDPESGTVKLILIRDVISRNDVISLNGTITNERKVENKTSGFVLRYDSDESDTNFHIPEGYSSVSVIDSYSDVISNVNPFDFKLYIDSRNGNSYMVKVDEEADSSGDGDNLNPSIFEVGGYCPVYFGDCTDDSRIESVNIPFSPIINTETNYYDMLNKAGYGEGDSNIDSIPALFISDDVEHGWKTYSAPLGSGKVKVGDDKKTSIKPQFRFGYYDFLGSNSDASSDGNFHPSRRETVVNSYDTGFMLGIMRGPGNEAGLDTYDENFDGEGNSRVSFTSANYSFTSDSVDNCNRDFDYNGDEAGGVNYDGRISLKLRAFKYDKDGNLIQDKDGNPKVLPKDRAERGLYDKFWKEYAYFTVNKKIVRLRLRMEIADLVTLDWTKRYRIGDYIGFVANWNVSVSNDGVSEVDMDMYYI